MPRGPEPLDEFTRRVPEHGRLRYGMKTDSGAPRSIDTWRFTTTDQAALTLLAETYGGTPKPWSPSKGRVEYELLSLASEIDVVVPPNALGGTPIYELWSAGGLLRRCDGEIAKALVGTANGAELSDQACICNARSNMECKAVTRVSLMLPDIPFNGVWRMEAKGWNAAHELPGMVEMVGELTASGRFARARLGLEKRQSKSGGQTRNFIVPVLRMPLSINEIIEGGATLKGITAPMPVAIEAAGGATAIEGDDDVVDAELIDDAVDPIAAELHDVRRLILQLELMAPDIAGFIYGITGDRTPLEQLDLGELLRLGHVLTRIANGELIYDGLRGSKAVVSAPPPCDVDAAE